jgi:sugar lactone lactonase YvrE
LIVPNLQQQRLAICFVVVLLAASFISAATRKSAVEEFAYLQKIAASAQKSGDHKTRLQSILSMVKLLNGAPDAVEASAEAYAEAGDTEHSLAALTSFADLGQADDNLLQGKNKNFASLEKLPEYQRMLDRFRANEKAISLAEKVFVIPDAGLLAEDIDYDPATKSFLITSVLEKKIIRITTDGNTTDFARSPSHWPMLALKVDAARKLVWATEVALNGFTAAPPSDWGRSAVLCFDLETGALKHRVEAATHVALGDMVLTPNGIPIVSDGDGGGIYEVKNDKLDRIDDGDFISPQTPVMHPDGNHVFVPDYVRGIGLLDLATKSVTWLQREPAVKFAVNGIDGLYLHGPWLIATQNGTAPERVVRFRRNSTLTGIDSEQIIERSTPTLGDPTHGVVVGGFFYYIANSGWDKLNEHGDLKPGSTMSPALVMRFELRDSRTKYQPSQSPQ